MSGTAATIPVPTIVSAVSTPVSITLTWTIGTVASMVATINDVLNEITTLRSSVASAKTAFDAAKTAFIAAEATFITALSSTDTALAASDSAFAKLLTDVNSITVSGESVSKTIVMASSSSAITDAAGSKWTIVSAQIAKNGIIDKTTSKVTEIAYFSHVVYYMNTASSWYSWSGSAWVAAKKPF